VAYPENQLSPVTVATSAVDLVIAECRSKPGEPLAIGIQIENGLAALTELNLYIKTNKRGSWILIRNTNAHYAEAPKGPLLWAISNDSGKFVDLSASKDVVLCVRTEGLHSIKITAKTASSSIVTVNYGVR